MLNSDEKIPRVQYANFTNNSYISIRRRNTFNCTRKTESMGASLMTIEIDPLPEILKSEVLLAIKQLNPTVYIHKY